MKIRLAFSKKKIAIIFPLLAVILISIFCIPLLPDIHLWGKPLVKARQGERNYVFNGTISREVLESYLSRAITFSSFLRREHLEGTWNKGNIEDNFRCITNIGAKFIGRAIFTWADEISLFNHINNATLLAARIHELDPEIILQAAIFEAVSIQVNTIAIPTWVFDEYGLIPEVRNFNYSAMYQVGGSYEDFWGANTTVPDMSQLEARMWFFFLAKTYIDMGIEAIHFGQIALMTSNDPDQKQWRDMQQRVRAYAQIHARRHMVICDAHVPNGGYVHDGNLLFDFHSFPLRPEEVANSSYQAQLIVGHFDSLYQRSKGGITPSGWACESLPYLVEFDNFGISDHPGEDIGAHWIWGYDEITWYALQSEEYRNNWLWYASEWLEDNDPNGFLEMPGSRPISVAINNGNHFFANTCNENFSNGFNQEETIKSIWIDTPNFYLE